MLNGTCLFIRSKVILSGFIFSFFMITETTQAAQSSFDDQFSNSKQFLISNMTRPDAMAGAVIAAPSLRAPDYYYHWVRDAALTVKASLDLYQDGRLTEQERLTLQKFYLDHLKFNQLLQKNSFVGEGPGEPKFLVNGKIYPLPWGRPQNDGPALRAQSLIQYYQILKRENGTALPSITPLIYQPEWPNNSLVKSDLEFTAHHWQDLNFDLWEEVYGYHFFTLMAQRKALIMGAQLAQEFQDVGASNYYLQQVSEINFALDQFWNPSENLIAATLKTTHPTKSNLDSAVLLAVLHSACDGCSFSLTDDRVLATFQKLQESFSRSYAINANSKLGTAFGRYPNDTYDGYKTNSEGNPWVLATAAAAEYLYRAAHEFSEKNSIQINSTNFTFFQSLARSQKIVLNQTILKDSSLFKFILSELYGQADQYLERIIFHKNSDGSLSEQINRDSGYMQGAPNLTWSHASFLTAVMARDRTHARLKTKKVQQ